MHIPEYSHTARRWDLFQRFYNHLSGPFYLLDTGELIIQKPDSRSDLRKYPTLNVEICAAHKLSRGERVYQEFTHFIDPRTDKQVPYTNLVAQSGGWQFFLIDYQSELIYGLSSQLTEDQVAPHIHDTKAAGYVSPRGIVARPITLTVPKKYSVDEKAHIGRMISACKAWAHMDTDVRVKKGSSPADISAYYKNEWMSLRKLSPMQVLYDKATPKAFTDLKPEVRLCLAYKPLLTEYEVDERSVLYYKKV